MGALPSRGDVSSYDTCGPCLTPASPRFWGQRWRCSSTNAGIQSNKPFQEIGPAAYQRLISDELLGAMHCTHIALPYMQKAHNGCIINISSVCALYGQALQSDYDAAKAALIGFSRGIANENAQNNIRVNCIAPASSPPTWWPACRKSRWKPTGSPFRCSGWAPRRTSLSACPTSSTPPI